MILSSIKNKIKRDTMHRSPSKEEESIFYGLQLLHKYLVFGYFSFLFLLKKTGYLVDIFG